MFKKACLLFVIAVALGLQSGSISAEQTPLQTEKTDQPKQSPPPDANAPAKTEVCDAGAFADKHHLRVDRPLPRYSQLTRMMQSATSAY